MSRISLQFGINLTVLEPGVPMAMYHWEADQEDFLVLAGEAVADRRGGGAPAATVGPRALSCRNEARDRRWGRSAVHCLLAVGARDHSTGPDWGGYSRGRGRAAPRRGRRAGDDRCEAGLRGARQSAHRLGTARGGFPAECGCTPMGFASAPSFNHRKRKSVEAKGSHRRTMDVDPGRREPAMADKPDTIVLIHGLWITRAAGRLESAVRGKRLQGRRAAWPGMEVEVEALDADP